VCAQGVVVVGDNEWAWDSTLIEHHQVTTTYE
jgi:hypothetical protein